MKKPWIIIDSARQQVDLAADDYEGKLPGLGDRFLRAVRSQLESIHFNQDDSAYLKAAPVSPLSENSRSSSYLSTSGIASSSSSRREAILRVGKRSPDVS